MNPHFFQRGFSVISNPLPPIIKLEFHNLKGIKHTVAVELLSPYFNFLWVFAHVKKHYTSAEPTVYWQRAYTTWRRLVQWFCKD